MPRHFTVEEANALLPQLKPRVKRMLELRRDILDRREAAKETLEGGVGADVGGRHLTELAMLFKRMKTIIEAIQETGVEIKDVNTGLLDFRAWREGREVYLCWRYGEPQVEYWHDLDAGFAGRQRLEE